MRTLYLLTLALLTAAPALSEKKDTTVVQKVEVRNGDNVLTGYTTFTYNKAGLVASSTYTQVSDGIETPYSKNEYQYDAAGRVTQSKDYYKWDEDGGMYHYATHNYAYDDAGHTTLDEDIEYDSLGNQTDINRQESAYDSEGRCILTLWLEGWDETNNRYSSYQRWEYTYAANGMRTHYGKYYGYTADGNHYVYEQTDKDESGRLLLTIADAQINGALMSEKKVYAYNEAEKTKTVTRYLSSDNYNYEQQDVETTLYEDKVGGKIKSVSNDQVFTEYYYTDE